LTAAAKWVLEVEQYARSHEGLVATVGRLNVTPNGSNVIPGRVHASLDVRHRCDETRHAAVSYLAPTRHPHLDQPAVPMDKVLTERLAKAVEAAGYPVHLMTSGAGHDAMIVAPHIPSAMLFVRSPGGISHSPQESVLLEDVAAALHVAQTLVLS
jgi:allantoate deiminase